LCGHSTHPMCVLRIASLSLHLPFFFFLTAPPPPRPTLFPYTTLFRSWARSYDGAYSRRPVYFAHFVFEGHELAAVQCLGIERETALVGRNVLNRFAILFDGPKLRFELNALG